MHGDQLDLRRETSWNQQVEEISPIEILEVQLVNSVVPLLLVSQLLPLLCAPHLKQESPSTRRPRFIVNVTSNEGQFSAPKTGEHVHTNMAKASVNMLTRTIADNLVVKNIYVTGVDTGWVSRMRPGLPGSRSIAPPLSVEDGAARVTHPVFDGVVKGEGMHGVLLKDFKVVQW